MKSFPWSLFPDLRCSCCGSRFEVTVALAASKDGLRDGALRCACYEYPVVEGIPVLRQLSPVSSTYNEAIQLLHAGDARGALHWLLSAGSASGVPAAAKSPSKPSWPLIGTLRRMLAADPALEKDGALTESDEFGAALLASRPREYANYLFHRFANPSFLGALPPLVVLGDACRQTVRRRLLDIMSGVGHSSAAVHALCPGLEVVMADADYVNLFLARRFVAPDTVAVCVDVDLPLPFSDRSFDGLFCLDGLHYVRAKVTLLEEVDRIVSGEGAWVFAHMHNIGRSNVNPGAPLSAEEYARRFTFGQQRLLPEHEVISQFRNDGALDLRREIASDLLASSDALTLVGAREDKLWRRHSLLDEAMARRPDLLALNPLYRVDRCHGGLNATAAWPSKALESECSGGMPGFRSPVHLSARTLEEIARAQAGGALSEEVRGLIRSSVLVCLPRCYPRTHMRVIEESVR